MGHPVELGTDCVVDLLPAVPEQVHPERRDAVEIFPPLRVEKVVPLPALDDERGVLLPVRHLGEGVPDRRLIPALQASRPLQFLSPEAPRRSSSPPCAPYPRCAWP